MCTKCDGWKLNTCFICRLEDYLIKDGLKPDTSDKKVHWNMENPKTCAYRSKKIDKTLDNSIYQKEPQKIYAFKECMFYNTKVLQEIL